MNLPETACVAIQGPQGLLDLGGFHWGDDIIFDSTSGGLDADAGFKQSTEMLTKVVNEVLVGKCGFARREIMVFGFGQGGMAALNLAGRCTVVERRHKTDSLKAHIHEASGSDTSPQLGGIISIGAGLPSQTSGATSTKCKTPVLVCAGSDQSAVTSATEDKLKRVFEFVEVKRYRKPGDSMPSNRDEMMPIMQFFSRRLRSTKGVPEGSLEVK